MTYLVTIPCRLVITLLSVPVSIIVVVILGLFEQGMASDYPRDYFDWLERVWS